MMATLPTSPPRNAPATYKPSISRSSRIRKVDGIKRPSRSKLLQDSGSLRSDDLAGRSVQLSPDVPTVFDAPLAPHHKLLGRWVEANGAPTRTFTRRECRTFIEKTFNDAVIEILAPITMVDLRAVIVNEHGGQHPAAVITCESIGQLDLGWIETSEAPMPWRAAAYSALEQKLGAVLPIIRYDDLFEELSMYYWDGENTDEEARQSQIDVHGIDPEEVDEETLPSAVNAKRPEWMLGTNTVLPPDLPPGLEHALKEFEAAHRAAKRLGPAGNGWHFDGAEIQDYFPDICDNSHLPPMTLVPFEIFAREIDDVARHGMEYGFMDIAGLCPLPSPPSIDSWFKSLRVGARLLLAAQRLIQLDPTEL